ncbi:MAG: ABC transporter ATP-binding protein [Planctomycetes bacterium]|nr:ABC transporter ATP-binding protein [Planctomycetota bacterium]
MSVSASRSFGTTTALRLLRRLSRACRSHPTLVGWVLLCLAGEVAADVAAPWILGQALGELDPRGSRESTGLPLLVGLFAAAAGLSAACRYGKRIGEIRLGQRVVTELRLRFHRKVLGLTLAELREIRRGELLARASRDVEKARALFGEGAFQALGFVIFLAGVLAMIALSSLAIAAVAAVAVLASGWALLAAAPRLGRRFLDQNAAYDDVAAGAREAVAGTRVIKAFGREDDEARRFATKVDRYRDRSIESWESFAGTVPMGSAAFALSVPASLAIGGWLVLSGSASIGGVAAALFLLLSIQNRLPAIGRLALLVQEGAASASRLFEVLDRPEVVELRQPPRPLPPGGGRIVFEGVSYAYPGGPTALVGVDLEVRPGETLAVVGPNGAGKTTFVALLGRFLAPTRGRILLDGVDLREIDPSELRRAIGFVFQETFLFSGTVGEAIRYGWQDAPDPRVEEAARLAQADRFIARLPQGYDTLVGERGSRLSGGQRQRLAIARALVLSPRVLVLDDWSASVDSRTQDALSSSLAEATRGRTTILMANRLGNVRRADRIAVLAGGKVREIGRHEELVSPGGWYSSVHLGAPPGRGTQVFQSAIPNPQSAIEGRAG